MLTPYYDWGGGILVMPSYEQGGSLGDAAPLL